MTTVHRIDGNQIYTGQSYEIDPSAGRKPNEIRQAPPELQPGEYAQWQFGQWAVLSDYPEPAPAPVPQSVTKRQAKEALIRQGSYQSALTVLDNIADPIEKAIANNYWTESQTFERDNPVLISLALGGLSMTETELDDLFRYAATL